MQASVAHATNTQFQLPERIGSFRGEINDVDSHEALPIKLWHEIYGKEIEPFAQAILRADSAVANRQGVLVQYPELDRDDAPIDAKSVWNMKMEIAPGAFDLKRRLEVMDFVGTKRQVLFPGMHANYALGLYNKASDPTIFASITGDRRGYAKRLLGIYNDWCAEESRKEERIRPTALLLGDTPDEAYENAKSLVKRGVRLFFLPMDEPLGGVSPAGPELDRLWALLAEARCPVMGHIAVSENLLKTLVWREAPAFRGWKMGGEFSLDPWTLSNLHLQVQNYIMTMVLGGVFDRHPTLIVGSAEFTGHWVGPLAENMDRFYGAGGLQNVSAMGDRALKLKPSEYIERNVRVMCFDFEPVGVYISRYGLKNVFCYASDYPHHEGGKEPINKFLKSLEGHSDEVLRKFFVENGKDLLPA